MEELVEEIKQLKLELNELREKVNQLPQTECNQLDNNKKRKFNKLDDTSKMNSINSSNKNLPNRYKRWLPEEEFQLIKELQNELKIYEIAKNHGRSNYAIECRIKKIVLEKSNTQSLESICSELKLDHLDINLLAEGKTNYDVHHFR